MKSEYTKGEWRVGWGTGLTGPTTQAVTPVCGGRDWPVIPVSVGTETIAICPAQTANRTISTSKPIEGSANANARLIAQAPKLYEALKCTVDIIAALDGTRDSPLCRQITKAIASVEGK